MPSCSRCHAAAVAGARFCIACGAPIATARRCGGCGTEGEAEARFCRECGQRFPDATPASTPARPTAPARVTPVPPAPARAATSAPTAPSRPSTPAVEQGVPQKPAAPARGRSRKAARPAVSSGGVIKLQRKGEGSDVIRTRLAIAFARAPGPDDPFLARLQFDRPFRKSQQDVLDAVDRWLADGQRQMHVVAPPGSGKTILGLELVRRLKRPALVLAPNTAIQGQWVDKCRAFLPPDLALERIASHDPDGEAPVVSLTYQALTTAASDDDFLVEAALEQWRIELRAGREGPEAETEAGTRIARMREANPDDYKREVSSRKSRVRQQMLTDPAFELSRLLHPNARALVDRLVALRVGTVILDECHHLTGFWALVVADLVGRLDGPVIVGLTATPPVDREDVELSRYLDLVGDIDFQVPTPAVVKEGHLAPYQDLVFLTQPLPNEEHFIASQHAQFAQLVRGLMTEGAGGAVAGAPAASGLPFLRWLDLRVNQRQSPADIHQPPETPGARASWAAFSRANPGFAEAAAKLLTAHQQPLAPDVPLPRQGGITLSDWAFVLEDYALHGLKLSAREDDHKRYQDIARATRALGLLLTETGFRAHTAPVDRVLALSASKILALLRILAVESQALGPDLRALVLTDYEKTSPTAVREVEGILDAEAGGAFAVIRALAESPETDALDPVLVTGSSVVCDADLSERFLVRARAWLEAHAITVSLSAKPLEGLKLHAIEGVGPAWTTRTYVKLVTALFEEGLTRCLVGTRALLGEGWDAVSINALVDLTAVTAFVTTNQLRGRSLRIDPRAPRKVADNWDVVCVAPAFEKGFNDYQRFARKHLGFHGLCDDGQIASGVSHVHPALTRTDPSRLGGLIDDINAEMLARPAQRERVHEAWKVGQPYRGVEVSTVEVSLRQSFGEPPPRKGQSLLQIIGQVFSASKGHTAATQSTLTGMATAVLLALQETGQIARDREPRDVTLSLRSDGFYRVVLDRASADDAELFARSVLEVLAPLADQRYLVPRYEQPAGLADRFMGLVASLGGGDTKGGLRFAQWHAVPVALEANKRFVDIYEKHWNAWVSPGQPVYAKHPAGKRILAEHRQQNPLGVETMHRTVWM